MTKSALEGFFRAQPLHWSGLICWSSGNVFSIAKLTHPHKAISKRTAGVVAALLLRWMSEQSSALGWGICSWHTTFCWPYLYAKAPWWVSQVFKLGVLYQSTFLVIPYMQQQTQPPISALHAWLYIVLALMAGRQQSRPRPHGQQQTLQTFLNSF